MKQYRVIVASALSSLALTACHSGDGVPREPLTGKITFEGRPLEKGMISFVSSQDPETTAGGVITEGAYTIPRGDGLAPGTYRVSIWSHQPTGKRIADRENPGTTIEEVRQVVPSQYNQKTQLSVDVKADQINQFDFDLVKAQARKSASTSR